MLESVHTIHEERIVHGDLKPANFVCVQGRLKLVDFGIAKAIQNDTTNIVRENQVGTMNYISPEALTDISTDTKQCMKVPLQHYTTLHYTTLHYTTQHTNIPKTWSSLL